MAMGPVGARSEAKGIQPGRSFLGLAVLLAALGVAGALAHGHAKPNRSLTVGLGAGSGVTLLAWNWGLQRRLRRRNKELEYSEAQIRATLNAIPDLLFEVDRDGRYLAVQALNPELLLVQQDQLLGRAIGELMPPAAAATCLAAIAEADAQGSSHGRQLLLPLPEGERWFELSVARKQGLAGAADTYVVLSRDIHAPRPRRRSFSVRSASTPCSAVAMKRS